MSAPLLIELALKSAIVAGVTLLLVPQLKRLPAAHRAFVAHIGLLVLALLPAAVILGPDVEVAGFWTRVIAAEPLATSATGAPASIVAPALAVGTVAPFGDVSTVSLMVMAWALGSLMLLAGLGLGLGRLFRLQGDASVLTDREWLGALAEAQHRMGLKQGTALLRSERLASPVSWGWLRPTIVLSPAALKNPQDARAILTHELAHVVRIDWLNLLVARLACALFWFNPLVWLLAWQAHELREEAADDVVLRGQVDGPDYASLLVAFARGESQIPALAAHGVAPGRITLKRRLQRVLDATAPRDPARPMWLLCCTVAALGLAAPLAAFKPLESRAAATVFADALHDIGAPAVPVIAQADREKPEPADDHMDAPADMVLAGPVIDEDPPQATVIRRAVGARLSADELAEMRAVGVTPEWIASLEPELPQVRQLSPETLASLAAVRVSIDWLKAMKDVGYNRLSVDQIETMAALRIGPAYVRELADAGYSDLPPNQLIRLKAHGVSTAYIRRMEAAGLRFDPADPAPPPSLRTRPPSPPTVPVPPPTT